MTNTRYLTHHRFEQVAAEAQSDAQQPEQCDRSNGAIPERRQPKAGITKGVSKLFATPDR